MGEAAATLTFTAARTAGGERLFGGDVAGDKL